MAKDKKVLRSFADLQTSGILVFEEEVKAKETIEKLFVKEKKEKNIKPLYDGTNIRTRGTQLTTTDGSYETFSIGAYTTWKITMVGQKNGAAEIGNDISNGYPHSSYHDRFRAAELLMILINSRKEN
jgi:hypothetical protein